MTSSLPKVITNFGKFNVRFVGPKTWNEIDETFKLATNINLRKSLKIIYYSLT
jgi:hypothetical protein